MLCKPLLLTKSAEAIQLTVQEAIQGNYSVCMVHRLYSFSFVVNPLLTKLFCFILRHRGLCWLNLLRVRCYSLVRRLPIDLHRKPHKIRALVYASTLAYWNAGSAAGCPASECSWFLSALPRKAVILLWDRQWLFAAYAHIHIWFDLRSLFSVDLWTNINQGIVFSSLCVLSSQFFAIIIKYYIE